MNEPDFLGLEERRQKLIEVSARLKEEFFGIDSCIDSVINTIQTWWLFPSALSRPVIVNLIGMTGVGKTALVRSLVNHLGVSSKFVEIQMEGDSEVAANSQYKTIADVLGSSSIEEGASGVILLDEFQRFRSKNEKGEDIKVGKYSDVWSLLSDGRLPADFSQLVRMERRHNRLDYWDDQFLVQEAEEEAKKEVVSEKPKYYREPKYKRKYYLDQDDASELKQILRLPEPVSEIMRWPKEKSREVLRAAVSKKNIPPLDYSKCLIFVCGNLDEAFKLSLEVEDCDTDADIYHQHTLKIGIFEIKQALTSRFRPEQIARFGNNYVIYPSLNRGAYMNLIRRACLDYVDKLPFKDKINFSIDENVYKEIYENSVYPAQGTRPVFSSIHKLFGSPLSDALLWALKSGLSTVRVSLDIPSSCLVFSSGSEKLTVKVDFEIRKRRDKRSNDFNALVSVHEAGHAIVYSSLFGVAPKEVAINAASFSGGYNIFSDTFLCKKEVLSNIAATMGGIAAEEIIFGPELRSTGAESDIQKATKLASKYVRRWGLDGYAGTICDNDMEQLFMSNVGDTNAVIENILKEQKERAKNVLVKHRALLISLSRELIKVRKVDAKTFISIVGKEIVGLKESENRDVSVNYAEVLLRADCS